MTNFNANNHTIAGISTASGIGAIAIVRVSGPESLQIADKLFCGKQQMPPSEWPKNMFYHGHVMDLNGRFLDEAILLVMRAPHSFTREDVVEFQIHGGPISARRVLQAVLKAGAKLSEPGEFTKRAFLNGRIDLIQAEAVMDIISAASDQAAASAANQLAGALSDTITIIYENLLSVASDFEAFLDFLEEEPPETLIEDMLQRLEKLSNQLQNLHATWFEGRVMREGALAVISGKPNVGKSTLLNALLGQERAIVSPQPGTTRDFIEETMIIEGFPIRLVDTAGLQNSFCEIEQQGIARSKAKIEQADIHLYVMDATEQDKVKDGEYLSKLIGNKKLIIIKNKKDLLTEEIKTTHSYAYENTVFISALYKEGLEELKNRIIETLSLSKMAMVPLETISQRHAHQISQALFNIAEAIKILNSKDTSAFVCAAIEIRQASEHIGVILGRVYDIDLLNSVFSRFCIGK